MAKNKLNNWQQINWKEENNKVAMLQDKIVKATQAKNMSLVFKLQRQLINCFEGRALAIRNVVMNEGSKTSGIDNIIWGNPEDKFKAIENILTITQNPSEYKASPLKRVMIPKINSVELRPLGIPTVFDRAIQAVYYLAVDPVVETMSDKNSYGFRKGRSQHDAIAYLRTNLDKIYSPKYILEADIAKCFEKIDHQFLIQHTPICDKHILKEWLTSGYIYKNKYFKTIAGTPQGGIISPMLCNVALNGMEKMIREIYPLNTYVSTGKPKVYFARYADDLVVTGNTPIILEKVRDLIELFLKTRTLKLKDSKTRITTIEKGFVFLGFLFIRKPYKNRLNNTTVTGQKTVLLIMPSKPAIQNFKMKIREILISTSILPLVIKNANPIIRGWTNYFIISYHSQEVFISLGHYIWGLLMKWVHRKHENIH